MLNPESKWMNKGASPSPDPADIVSRIGAQSEPCELLPGGLANTNIKIGKHRVLRIYRRDSSALLKERALLLKPWQFLAVPKVFATGHDYLLLSFVEHHPLKGSAQEGEALGCALSEIHGRAHSSAGLLGPDLELAQPWDDLLDSLAAYMRDCFGKLDANMYGDLGKAACACFEKHAGELRQAAGPPVLLHADFKFSNLHATTSGPPLVLDWEFAYSGSALSDIGQLMRWNPPKRFVQGFEAAYQASDLGPDWRRQAALMDLPNLAGLLVNTPSGSIRGRDITVLIKEIIQ